MRYLSILPRTLLVLVLLVTTLMACASPTPTRCCTAR